MYRSLLMAGVLGMQVLLATAQEAKSEKAPETASDIQLTPEEGFAKAKELIEKQGDFFSAMPLLRPAADAGNVRAQVWLAQFLDYGEENEEAEKYYRMAIAQDDPEAKLGLAIMHVAGDTAKPDLAAARQLVEGAANQGFAQAIKILALAYIKGGLGISDDERQSTVALTWINRSADLDDIDALRKLEEIYRSGSFAVTLDEAKADEIQGRINKLTGVEEKTSGRRRRR